MIKILPLLLLFILSSNPIAYAGLGESASQVAERYGQPLFEKLGSVPDSTWRSYRFQGITIDVESFDGVSQREMFRRPNGRFSMTEVKSMLNANVLEGRWENLEKLDEPDADDCVEQQGVELRRGKEIVADASLSVFFVEIHTTKFFFRRTHMYPGGNIP